MEYTNFLIKPASSLCNMRCRYCFYADEAKNRDEADMGIMTDGTGELLIKEAIARTNGKAPVSFAFQGGEPTVAGLDFFRKFTETARRLNTKHVPIQYSIQTNALCLNDEWAKFFRDENFLVGVSLDGDKAMHDGCRVDAAGKGTWNRVMHNLDLLKKYGVDVNLLCVVTRSCSRSAVRVYNALKKTGIRYLQFIACLDPLGSERGSMAYSLSPKDYGTFLCDLFDAWYLDWENGEYTSVRLFDDYVHLAMGMPAGTCATSGSCGSYFVVEADGSIYPCDFYALDEWRMGKLGEEELTAVSESENARRFLDGSKIHPAECSGCKWYNMCFGGCRRDWYTDPDTGETKNYFCPAFREFFDYAMPRIERIAAAEKYVSTYLTDG